MFLYLDLSFDEMRARGLMKTKEHLHDAIVQGTVMRLRPMFMTVAVDFVGLVPVMMASGTGSDVMKRITAPLFAGMLTAFVMGLVVYPAIYAVWKWHTEVKKATVTAPANALPV